MGTSDRHPTTTLDDIRTAFLLGWSIVELKSRVLIAAFTMAMDADTLQNIADSNSPPVIANLPKDETMSRACDLIYNSMKTMLQPETAKKLHEFVAYADKDTPNGKYKLPTVPSDDAWMTSTWRTVFNRIAMLHYSRFPESDTTNSIYDIPIPQDTMTTIPAIAQVAQNTTATTVQTAQVSQDTTTTTIQTAQVSQDTTTTTIQTAPAPPYCKAVPYLYLYPQILQKMEPDYATVGASRSAISDDFIRDFKLYDITRRALNCLALLFTDPEESLIPETAMEHRWWLVQNMLHPTDPVDYREDATQKPQDEDINLATRVLSGLIVRFLDGWDSFLRESFYVDTDASSSDNEIELIAYEAGRSLSLLTWSFSTVIAPLEEALRQVPEDGLIAAQDALMQQVIATLQSVFNDRDISTIQRQIFSLTTALDDFYYRANPNVPRSGAADSLTQSNPELPSEAIHAVKHSLTYWQRTVDLLCSANNISDASLPKFLPIFRWHVAKKLRKALIEQSEIWQSLILCHQSLNSFTIEKVTQRLLSDFMKNFEEAVRHTVKQDLDRSRSLRWILIASAIVLIGIIGVFIYFLASQQRQLQTVLPVIILILGGIVGFLGSIINRVSNWFSPPAAPTSLASTPAGATSAGSDLTQRFASLFGAAGSAMVDAFHAGYERILIEFGDLNYAICVADPLVDFLVLQNFALYSEKSITDSKQTTANDGKSIADSTQSNVDAQKGNWEETLISDSYLCLTKIFWTEAEREQEMQNVVRAAFGPLGAFVNVQLQEPSKAAQAQNRP